jgi:hypothetical protein
MAGALEFMVFPHPAAARTQGCKFKASNCRAWAGASSGAGHLSAQRFLA